MGGREEREEVASDAGMEVRLVLELERVNWEGDGPDSSESILRMGVGLGIGMWVSRDIWTCCSLSSL